MKNERRNDKEHQKQRLDAYQEAELVLWDLHQRIAKRRPTAVPVDRRVILAAGAGWLQSSGRRSVRLEASA
ncbi:MAG: hypothetical protein JW810_12540 [Sedimentisphaerales bacterium]|nr:hypothetical protein [Sedimentisphaerales bacterium]